jgi:hypothetical protein
VESYVGLSVLNLDSGPYVFGGCFFFFFFLGFFCDVFTN